MRRFVLPFVLLPACFNPDSSQDTDDSTFGTSSTGSEATGEPTSAGPSTDPGTTNPDPSTDPGTTNPDPTDPDPSSGGTTSDEDTDGTTTDFVPGCDNGVVEDDELCFQEAAEIDSLVSTQGVAIADVDDDGHQDVIVGDYGDGTEGGLYVYLGNGDGTFEDPIHPDDSRPLIRVAAGAIADGVVDVVAMNAGSTDGGVLRFRGNADGSFSSITNIAEASTWDVALAEITGDARLDLLSTTSSIELRPGTGTEGFGTGQTYGLTNGFQCVKAIDVDNDDDLDVFGCSFDGIYPLINDGGTLEPGDFFGQGINDILTGDFDGDGNNDIAGTGSSLVTVYFGNGSGGFAKGVELTVNDSPIAGKSVDIDGDGYDDIVVVNTSGTTSILLSNGDRTFQTQQLFTMLDGYLYDMDMGDLNEDGGQDIVVVSPNGGPIQMLLSHV